MDAWHKAHRLTVQALLEPPNARDKKVLGKILRKPIPEHLKKRVLDFQAYDKLNTSMSLSKFTLIYFYASNRLTSMYRLRSPWGSLLPTLTYEPLM